MTKLFDLAVDIGNICSQSLLLLFNSIQLSLNKFYIHQLWENVTEPTDRGDVQKGDFKNYLLW
jgi:hypothetical protein